jgi:hypothetical protein
MLTHYLNSPEKLRVSVIDYPNLVILLMLINLTVLGLIFGL